MAHHGVAPMAESEEDGESENFIVHLNPPHKTQEKPRKVS
jgi:hypothetical protein